MRLRIVIGIGAGCVAIAVLSSAAIAGAQQLPIDRHVPPNGVSTPDYPRTPLLSPLVSPIQVPAPRISTTRDTAGQNAPTTVHRTYIYYPYISPVVHNAIPVPRGAVLDASGAIAVTLPTPAGGTVTLNPNGHCIFSGDDTDEADAAAHPEQWISTPAVVVDTPVFQVHIAPRVWVAHHWGNSDTFIRGDSITAVRLRRQLPSIACSLGRRQYSPLVGGSHKRAQPGDGRHRRYRNRFC